MILLSARSSAQTIIPMEKNGGVYKIPCVVNGLKLKLIFDTGATNVCISESVAQMMLENDYLASTDILGNSQMMIADGSIVNNTKINLKKIQIGDITIHNVEAYVVESQIAPLLLGQSAIKKLGKYTISGDNLIIGSMPEHNTSDNVLSLTDKEIEDLREDAARLYDENEFTIALEKYKVLKQNNILNVNEKFCFADCYFYTRKYNEALIIYKDIENDVVKKSPSWRYDLYFQIGRCYYNIDDYNNALPYLKKALYYSEMWSVTEVSAMYLISLIYRDTGDVFMANNNIDNYIEKYLSFMDIEPTDCWNKCYIDKFLGMLYFYKTFFVELKSDRNKYYIISAAWGCDEALEFCKQFNLKYLTKPYEYEY